MLEYVKQRWEPYVLARQLNRVAIPQYQNDLNEWGISENKFKAVLSPAVYTPNDMRRGGEVNVFSTGFTHL